jgi:leucine dehydrogenase
MPYKCALADIAGGGAKLVVLDQPELDLERAYRQIGRWIERLGGRYYAGPDVGTGDAEIRWMAAETEFVAPPEGTGPGDLAGATAAGVFAGMAAALRSLDGEEDWGNRTVVVQGLGRVGLRVAERLRGLQVRVLATEVDANRLARAQQDLGVEPLEPGSEFGVSCDIFSPCAMGGILHDITISRLDTRVVCGASNNPLARSAHGLRLHERQVLYVPDYVVNAGAVILGAEYHLAGRATPLEEIEVRIGTLAADILREASEENRSPVEVAEREAVRRLEESRRKRVEQRQRMKPSEVAGPR